MKLLSAPPNLNGGGRSSAAGSSICQNITTVQGISVCEDRIDFQDCTIISSISSNMCDHFGSLQFEKYWSQRGCKVTVFHLFIFIKGNVCNTPGDSQCVECTQSAVCDICKQVYRVNTDTDSVFHTISSVRMYTSNLIIICEFRCFIYLLSLFVLLSCNMYEFFLTAGPLKDYPNINIIRGDMWGEKCFNCVFKMIKAAIASSDKKSEQVPCYFPPLPLLLPLHTYAYSYIPY